MRRTAARPASTSWAHAAPQPRALEPATSITPPLAVRGLGAWERARGGDRSGARGAELLEAAAARTGLCDFGDAKLGGEALADFGDALFAHLRAQGTVTAAGYRLVYEACVSHLIQRLYLVDLVRRHPEIWNVPIHRPVFVTGVWRSGTTLAHNLLATLPTTRPLAFWELLHTAPAPRSRPSPAWLRLRTLAHCSLVNSLSPAYRRAHRLTVNGPEECLYLFARTGYFSVAFTSYGAHSYGWWMLRQDLSSAYAFYKLQLQALQWMRPGERLVLKWPLHLWHLDRLWGEFPDGCLVQCYRDPARTISSLCNHARILQTTVCSAVRERELGRFWTRYVEVGFARALGARSHINPAQVVDVHYDDLVGNPSAEVRRICRALDLKDPTDLDELVRGRLGTGATRPSNLPYDAADFGLRPEALRERFACYEQAPIAGCGTDGAKGAVARLGAAVAVPSRQLPQRNAAPAGPRNTAADKGTGDAGDDSFPSAALNLDL